MATCVKKGDRWTARLTWTDPTMGDRKWRRVTARLKSDCEEKLRDAERAARERPGGEPAPTLSAWAREWLAALAFSRKDATVRAHERRLRVHVLPVLGDRTLDRITPRDVSRLLSSMGLADATIASVHASLSACLLSAVAHGLIPRSPTSPVKVRKARPRGDGFTREEVRAIAARLDPATRTLVLLTASTGLRLGEVVALTPADLDLGPKPVLRVERTRVYGPGGDTASTPKSGSSRRTVPLGPQTAAMLRSWIEANRIAPGDSLWPGPRGTALCRRTTQNRFNRARDMAGVRPLPFHALRHSAATFMLEDGVHPLVAMEYLGHSSVQVTMSVYSHVTEDVRFDAAGVAERGLLDT